MCCRLYGSQTEKNSARQKRRLVLQDGNDLHPSCVLNRDSFAWKHLNLIQSSVQLSLKIPHPPSVPKACRLRRPASIPTEPGCCHDNGAVGSDLQPPWRANDGFGRWAAFIDWKSWFGRRGGAAPRSASNPTGDWDRGGADPESAAWGDLTPSISYATTWTGRCDWPRGARGWGGW